MRRIHFSVLIGLFYLFSCGNQSPAPQQTTPTTPVPSTPQITPPSQAAGYTLAFSDDFSSFDLSPDGNGAHT